MARLTREVALLQIRASIPPSFQKAKTVTGEARGTAKVATMREGQKLTSRDDLLSSAGPALRAAALWLEHLPLALLAFDESGAGPYSNAAARRLLGAPRGCDHASVLEQVCAAERRGECATICGGLIARRVRTGPAAADACDLVLLEAPERPPTDALQARLLRLEEEARQLEALATLDPLTRVLNRRGVEAALEREVARARRRGSGLVALLVDCDGFKSVNDAYGHAGGDCVLREVAARLASALRSSDSIGRIGGDEFLALLPETRSAEGLLVAERARRAVADAPVHSGTDEIPISVSIGAATIGAESLRLDQVLMATRAAFERSKRGGRNRVCLDATLPEEQEMLAGLAALLQGQDIAVDARPIVRLPEGEPSAWELDCAPAGRERASGAALLRFAREQGLARPVDRALLRAARAHAQAKGLGGELHLRVSPETLLGNDPEGLLRLLAPPGGPQVWLQLSEQDLVGDQALLRLRVDELRAGGLRLCLDSLGAGRGTVETALLLGPERVKVDGSLLRSAARDRRRRDQLVRLLRLSAALGSTPVVKGVDGPEELALACELGIGLVQGRLWPSRSGQSLS